MTKTFAQHARRLSFAIYRLVLVAAALLCVALANEPAFAQSGSGLQIDYTGALFGYFRTDGPKPGVKLTTVDNFLKSRTNRPIAIRRCHALSALAAVSS